MKKLKRRTVVSLLLMGMLGIGMAIFLYRYVTVGDEWVSFPVNRHVFSQGNLAVGKVVDRNGLVLTEMVDGERIYNESKAIRRSTLHIVGDAAGNIGTGILSQYKAKLMGYNPVVGVTLSGLGDGGKVTLTIDSKLCAAAYDALDGRDGTVLISNYKTGDILCMVSSPGFDPANPPKIDGDSKGYEGVYINKAYSSRFVPGSVFKLLTTAAAIETIPDLFDQEFVCKGQTEVNGEIITCEGVHGTIGVEDALAVSCNLAFAEISQQVGGEKLSEYMDKYAMTGDFKVDKIRVAPGGLEIAEDGSPELSWSGIGQDRDLINPLRMLRFVGAIANGGRGLNPKVLEGSFVTTGVRMTRSLSEKLTDMMRYNVTEVYGDKGLAGLNLCAKTGTAEVGGGKKPHAWYVGFLNNDEFPYAFVVLIENGGSGRTAAGGLAVKVLKEAIK